MKKPFFTAVTLLVVVLCGTVASTQENLAPGSPPANGKEKAPKVLIRVRAKGDFVGTVIQVNTVSNTVTVKNKGIVVTFDVLNPVFKGFRALEQIKAGDKVAVSYTGDGARITKVTGDYVAQQEAALSRPEGARPKQHLAKIDKGRPIRVRERTRGCEFRDVDNNNDGKITPVELSAVVPNLTVQDFKKYDRNNDGALNESEYNTIKSSVTRDR
jgi:hypothetical protein